MVVVFDHVDVMPAKLVDVVDDLALEVVGRDMLRATSHVAPFPISRRRALPQESGNGGEDAAAEIPEGESESRL
jgi:hypothetical protein